MKITITPFANQVIVDFWKGPPPYNIREAIFQAYPYERVFKFANLLASELIREGAQLRERERAHPEENLHTQLNFLDS